MDYITKRIEQIKDNVKIQDVIRDYGLHPYTYDIDEFQMRCPFHGKDDSPSSHVYADGFFHCFTCQRHYDVIAFVQEKENIDKFSNALRFLEHRYGLKKIEWVPGDVLIPNLPDSKATEMSREDLFKIVEKRLIANKKKLGFDKYSKMFFVLDTAMLEERTDLMLKVREKLDSFTASSEPSV